MSSFVFFSVGLCLSLHLQIINFFLQRLLPEHSLVSFPLTPPQVLLLVRQLQRNASTDFNTRRITETSLLIARTFHCPVYCTYTPRPQKIFCDTFVIPKVQCLIKGSYKYFCIKCGLKLVHLVKIHLLLQYNILLLIKYYRCSDAANQQFSCCLGKLWYCSPEWLMNPVQLVFPPVFIQQWCPPQLENCPHCLMLRQWKWIIGLYFSPRTYLTISAELFHISSCKYLSKT